MTHFSIQWDLFPHPNPPYKGADAELFNLMKKVSVFLVNYLPRKSKREKNFFNFFVWNKRRKENFEPTSKPNKET